MQTQPEPDKQPLSEPSFEHKFYLELCRHFADGSIKMNPQWLAELFLMFDSNAQLLLETCNTAKSLMRINRQMRYDNEKLHSTVLALAGENDRLNAEVDELRQVLFNRGVSVRNIELPRMN